MNTDGFICSCNNSIEKEFLQKMIFGYSHQIQQFAETNMLSKKGFLYNNDSDELIGPFVAITPFKMNIDPKAFDGQLPFQVRVSSTGKIERKSRAVKFFGEIFLSTSISQKGIPLPVAGITNDQFNKLISWIEPHYGTNIEKEINNLVPLIANPLLAHQLEVLRIMLQVPELTESEADESLKFLRENVIKKDFPDSPDNLGLLRKSFKHHLLAEKISDQDDFDDLCSSPSYKYDERQNKYLPLIFEIIKMIRLH
jgi:hypothetical protein